MAKKISKKSKGSDSKAKTSKPKVLQLDFTGVESRKKGRRVPEGDYLLKITDYAKGDDGDGWLRVEHKIKRGPVDGEYSEMFGLGKKSLWRFRNFLEAIGMKTTSSLNKIKMEKIVGKTYAATIEDNTYDNKKKSQIAEFYSKDEWDSLTSDEEEEEADDVDLTDGDEDEDEEEAEDEEDEDEDEDEDDDDEELEDVDEDDI